MRQTIIIIPLLLAAGHAMGCASEGASGSEPSKPSETAAAGLDEVKTQTNEAAQAMQDYAYGKKGEFVSNMEKDLVEIQSEIDRMSIKVDSTGGAAKADAEAKLDAVREKWAQTKNQLDRAEIATESNWKDNIDGFNQSYGELKNSFNTTRQWLSDKIEP